MSRPDITGVVNTFSPSAHTSKTTDPLPSVAASMPTSAVKRLNWPFTAYSSRQFANVPMPLSYDCRPTAIGTPTTFRPIRGVATFESACIGPKALKGNSFSEQASATHPAVLAGPA